MYCNGLCNTSNRQENENRKCAKTVTLRQLHSLIGSLNFAVIWTGHAFLRRMIDLTNTMAHPLHFIRLTKETTADSQTKIFYWSI